MNERFVTSCGRACMEQAKLFGLLEFYDPFTGTYAIPDDVYESNSNVYFKAIKLLKEGKCFNDEGKAIDTGRLCLSIDKSYGEGSGVNGTYMYYISEMPVVK